jgi:uncharacterized delta-60 repeat protein
MTLPIVPQAASNEGDSSMWLFASRKARPRASDRPRPRPCRPRLEALEDRCLLNAGALDPTFGNGAGYVTTAVNSGANDQARAVLVQPSGNIVVAGVTTVPVTTTTKHGTTTSTVLAFGVVTYNPDGSLDTAFGSGGIVRQIFQPGNYSPGFAIPYDAALEPTGATGDAKIVLAGGDSAQNGMALMRLNANGSLDASFGSSGQVVTWFPNTAKYPSEVAKAVAVTVNGQIVAAGESNNNGWVNWLLARYNPDGALDPTFGNGGEDTTTFSSGAHVSGIVPQADGKIVLVGMGGSVSVLARYNSDGSLDPTFGSGGIAATVGPAGASDRTFLGEALYPSTDPTNAGKIVAVGRASFTSSSGGASQPLVERFNPDGSLDSTFGNGAGYVTIGSPQPSSFGARAVTVQADGKLVVVGAGPRSPTNLVARLNADGSFDTTFGQGGLVTTAIGVYLSGSGGPYFNGVALQANGEIVAAGEANIGGQHDFSLARYLPSEPEVGSFTASPNPVTAGSSLTLTASNITDGNAGSTVTQVAFYANVNGANTLLGYGTQTSPGVWTLTFTVSLPPGSYTLTAQATDSYGVLGDPFATALTVQ